MIFIHWGYCRCEDCDKTFYTPLNGNGAAAYPHSGCKEAAPTEYESVLFDVAEDETEPQVSGA